jgi:putative FmdB family regulatory protein
MPTYDYACRLCDHQFESFHSIKDEPLVKCPSCGKKGLRRLIGTGAGIIFKGSGFYETDYKRSSGSPTSGDSGGESTTSDKPKTSGSESTKSSSESSSSASKTDT